MSSFSESTLIRQTLRFALGLMFVVRGTMKIAGWPSYPTLLLAEYTMIPAGISTELAVIVLVLELGMGAWLLSGVKLPYAALGGMVLLIALVLMLGTQHVLIAPVDFGIEVGMRGVTDEPWFVLVVDAISAFLAGWLAVLATRSGSPA